jgi:hypothetical protein
VATIPATTDNNTSVALADIATLVIYYSIIKKIRKTTFFAEKIVKCLAYFWQGFGGYGKNSCFFALI